jgi:glycosyltransferase involved in cell wall biosynthesis
MQNTILADGRWQGVHGIGRFSHEVLSRLQHCDILNSGPNPLSLKNLFWQPYALRKHKNHYNVFFSPGFNPILFSSIPYVFTIHDLIHLHIPGKAALIKKFYYELLTKPSAKKAFNIITVSEYSKNQIIEWANISEKNITVVSSGISHHFKPDGIKHQPGYPYLLHVGNTKPHKNVTRLVEAFAIANIATDLKLILTGNPTPELEDVIKKYRLQNRVIFVHSLSDEKLAEYYRGAHTFILPSLYEGFGLPPIEAMACGTPVVAANTTSLPEVVGDAAVLVNPYQTEAIAEGIEKLADESLRNQLISKGFMQSKRFSWEKTAERVQQVLDQAT